MIKRIFDILFSSVLLILLSPLLCLVSIIIKLTSKGPVIYKAKRIGKEAKPFTLYKFRSMHVDSGIVRVTTLRNDERIYPFGKFIRKTKIDELPQLLNILIGQMSVVGPRPEDIDIAKNIYVGEYEDIYSIKPGLTSPASLFDYTHGELYENEELYIEEFLPQKLDMELHYVKNKSFIYDIQLIIRTGMIIIQMFFGKKKFKYPREYYLMNVKNTY